MSDLTGLTFKETYFSPNDDAVRDFMIPALKNCDEYHRTTGFFSSTSLVQVSVGVCDLASRGGKIKILTSPKLSQEDVDAIKSGYEMREVVGTAMLRDFVSPQDSESIDRLALLSELIARGTIDIRVVVMRNIDAYPNSMFHAKMGVMIDSLGNRVAFTGSMNETANGMVANWDMIDVFSDADGSSARIDSYERKFEALWSGTDPASQTMEVPKVVMEVFDQYRKGEFRLDLDEIYLVHEEVPESVYFKSPAWLKLRPYQEEAIDNWVSRGYHGVFDMATGTGKTKTAMCALERLYNDVGSEGIFTIIVAPQKHLVDQWAEEVGNFGVNPLVGHSDTTEDDWKGRFRRQVRLSKDGAKNFCLVVTVASFSTEEFNTWVSKIRNLALVVDEAHNMGSSNRIAKLPSNAKYRLALSATMERYRDATGTMNLMNYFGEKCIRFTLEDAIGKYLTNYYYHPILCVYSDDEYYQLVDANHKLDVILSNPRISKTEKKKAKNEYLQYSYSLNVKMEAKYDALHELMASRLGDDHFLVYCGKLRVNDDGEEDENGQVVIQRAIDKTSGILGMNGLGFKISRITYRENAQERKKTLSDFEAGDLDGIVAISCLDEGVDIPSIRTAVFMSSSNNPREYVQRRGRVLRMHPGKEYAELFDMVVMPRSLDNDYVDPDHFGVELKLLTKEMRRMEEFSKVSLNRADTEEIFQRISDKYGLTIEEIMETYGEDYDERD